MANADAVLDGIALNIPILRLDFEAIVHTARPDLFETPEPRSARGGLPWPIEPHNWPVIGEDWWKPHSIASDDALVMVEINSFAEDLAGSNCHPGMIVRKVRCEFAGTTPDCEQVLNDTVKHLRGKAQQLRENAVCPGTGQPVKLLHGRTVCSTCFEDVDTARIPKNPTEASDLVALRHGPL